MNLQALQQPSTIPTDEAVVRTLYQRLMDGWNDGNADAFAAPFAEDGDLVAFDGTHFKGRSDIVAFHHRLFQTYLKGTRLTGEVTDLRFLNNNVAVMHAAGSTIMRGKSFPSPERDSIQTLVAVRLNGSWQLAAFQNTRIRPMGRSAGCTFVWLLTDWLWKVFRPRP
jgi:uncharacterized protein (TIGR02246 family)